MNGTITNEGKVTVSLTIKQWIAVIGAVLMVGFYVYRIETGRIDAKKFQTAQDQLNTATGKRVANHEWRIGRVERRLGIKRVRPARAASTEQDDDDQDAGSWFWQN